MSLNVNRAVTDQFYRYKMPRLLAKVEGSGNGIKTAIVNMVDIGKSLCRPPTYPTKFFGCELGAQTQLDFKNNRFIVNGSHDANKLQDLLDIFIKKYVLCPGCDNPETFLIVKKGNIGQRCIACGHFSIIDLRHKLSSFIIKNPPEHDPRSVGSSKSVDPYKKTRLAAERKWKKSRNKQQHGEGDSCRHKLSTFIIKNPPEHDPRNVGSSESVDLYSKTRLVAERKWKKSRNIQQSGEGDACQEEEYFGDDELSADTSEEAIRERMGDLSGYAKGLTLNDDLEKTGRERLNIFYKFVEAKKAGGDLKGCDKEFLLEAERLDVKDKGPLVLAELLLDEQVLTQLKQHRYHFLRLLKDSPKGQKYFLTGLEQLIALHAESLVPKVPSILKAVYDLDLIDEDVILTWAATPSRKYVSKEVTQQIRERAAPFIKWLKEAEEEESSEDEVVVVFSNRGGGGLKVEPAELQKASAGQSSTPPAAKEDDFDIDDI